MYVLPELFRAYSDQVLEAPHPFDLVMVDGRFRVACVLKAVKKARLARWRGATVLLHDYRIADRDYGSFLETVLRPAEARSRRPFAPFAPPRRSLRPQDRWRRRMKYSLLKMINFCNFGNF